jgi:hypothetical protein
MTHIKWWEIMSIVLAVVTIVGGTAWLGTYLQGVRSRSPHCVCSQQTCFQAPDGGWRE